MPDAVTTPDGAILLYLPCHRAPIWALGRIPPIETTEELKKLFGILDNLTEEANTVQKKETQQYFLKSCEMEWRFWEQALTQENWKFNGVILLK